jgi:hypothetical protein
MSEKKRDIMWKFPMEKLTLNEEKVWTILKDFPNGAKAELLKQLTKLPRTTLYECLDGLAEKNYVENKNRKWYPKIAEAEKPSTEKVEDSFKASLMRHYQKMLGYAEELYLEGELLDSRDTLRLLVRELPPPQREKIEKQFGRVLHSKYFNYLEIENLIAAIIETLLEISSHVPLQT